MYMLLLMWICWDDSFLGHHADFIWWDLAFNTSITSILCIRYRKSWPVGRDWSVSVPAQVYPSVCPCRSIQRGAGKDFTGQEPSSWKTSCERPSAVLLGLQVWNESGSGAGDHWRPNNRKKLPNSGKICRSYRIRICGAVKGTCVRYRFSWKRLVQVHQLIGYIRLLWRYWHWLTGWYECASVLEVVFNR